MEGSLEEAYSDGSYAALNPSWHIEHSPWKAAQVLKMIARNHLKPAVVCEVGCGAGEILLRLHDVMYPTARFVGWEISPDAHALSLERLRPGLEFKLGDFLTAEESDIDLLLLMDVIEHVEDHLAFLRRIRTRSRYTMLHIPLDLSVEWVLRARPLINERRVVRHLHSFTKELALETLGDTGYEVVDWFYTRPGLDLDYPTWRSVVNRPNRATTALRKLFEQALQAVDQDLCARLIRGWSLLVLARDREISTEPS